MGNNQEVNNKNEILGKFNMQVNLNKFHFYPGETIKGEIKLFSKDPESNEPQIISNPKLYYALIHKECWQNIEIIDPKNKNKNNPKENNINEDNFDMDNYRQEIIFSKNEINNSLKNKSIKNNLTIPFQFKIPINTISSFEYNNSSKIYGYSRIYLDIEIPETLNKKEILIFIQKIPAPLNSELTISKYITKKKLGFIGSGSNINFEGSYPKNAYGFSEICPLNISLDIFGSKENINGINFTLKRKIIFMKNNNKIFNEFIEDLWQYNMKENNLKKNIEFNLPLIEPDRIIKEKKYNFFDINTINKDNLICLLPSYDGYLIKCHYYILIKISYESLLIKNPEIEMPIDLGHTQTIFTQTCMFDVNKILGKINDSLILSFMPDFNNNDIINNNKNQIDMKSKMKGIFGESSQKNKIKQENINKVFGSGNKIINKPSSNKKEETPFPQNSINYNNNINNENLSNSGSQNLPSEDEIYTTKDEQAAPGLEKKD